MALRRRRTRAELEQALRSASDETERLTRLTEDLLLIARSDAGELPIKVEPVSAAGCSRSFPSGSRPWLRSAAGARGAAVERVVARGRPGTPRAGARQPRRQRVRVRGRRVGSRRARAASSSSCTSRTRGQASRPSSSARPSTASAGPPTRAAGAAAGSGSRSSGDRRGPRWSGRARNRAAGGADVWIAVRSRGQVLRTLQTRLIDLSSPSPVWTAMQHDHLESRAQAAREAGLMRLRRATRVDPRRDRAHGRFRGSRGALEPRPQVAAGRDAGQARCAPSLDPAPARRDTHPDRGFSPGAGSGRAACPGTGHDQRPAGGDHRRNVIAELASVSFPALGTTALLCVADAAGLSAAQRSSSASCSRSTAPAAGSARTPSSPAELLGGNGAVARRRASVRNRRGGAQGRGVERRASRSDRRPGAAPRRLRPAIRTVKLRDGGSFRARSCPSPAGGRGARPDARDSRRRGMELDLGATAKALAADRSAARRRATAPACSSASAATSRSPALRQGAGRSGSPTTTRSPPTSRAPGRDRAWRPRDVGDDRSPLAPGASLHHIIDPRTGRPAASRGARSPSRRAPAWTRMPPAPLRSCSATRRRRGSPHAASRAGSFAGGAVELTGAWPADAA